MDGQVLNRVAAGAEIAQQASQNAVQHLWNSLAGFCVINGPAQWSQPPHHRPLHFVEPTSKWLGVSATTKPAIRMPMI